MQRLLVENKELDLGFEEKIPLTLQANDLGNISTRNSSYSNSIVIPNTGSNKAIFDYLGVNANTSTAPYRKLRCRYSIDNITLIENGYLQVLEVNEKGYKVNLYDGIVDLNERIKGLSLKDLNYSDLDHFINTETFISSFDNNSGYIYALGDFGKPISSPLKVESQSCSIYTHTIWEKIFSEAGIVYKGDFFTTNEDFLTEVITPTKGFNIENIGLTEVDLGNTSTNEISRYEQSSSYISYLDKLTISNIDLNAAKFTHVNGELVSLFSGKVRINLSVNFAKYKTNLSVKVRLNGNDIGFVSLNSNSGTFSNSYLINVEPNDIISLDVFSGSELPEETNNEGLNLNLYTISFNLDCSINIEEISGGQLIDVNSFVPDLKQSDFIKDILQRYGLVMKPSKESIDVYEFSQIEKLLNDKENAIDYTSNFISKNNEDFKTSYAKENKASYKYPKEITERLFDGFLIIDNENIKTDDTLFSSPYEIPVQRPSQYQGYTMYRVPIWEQDKDDNAVFNNIETEVKIFRVKRVDDSFNFRYFDEVNSTEVLENIPFLSLEKIEMQYFLNVYYKSFKKLIDRYKAVDFDFFFSTIDLLNINLFKLIFLSQTGRYYYPQKFKLGNKKNTSSELLEITEFSNNLPPTRMGVYDVSLGFEGTREITLENLTVNANPSYFDPEFDDPLKVKIKGGFSNPELDIFSNGVQITQETEIDADSFNLSVTDTGINVSAHQSVINFDIADKGSGQYSGLTGTLNINVSAFNNQPPIANAGENQEMTIDENFQETKNTNLFGGASSDNTGDIIKYEWIILSGPSDYDASISDSSTSTPDSLFVLPYNLNNIGTFNIQLKVTDSFGLTDTDNMIITVNYEGGIFQ